MQVLKQKSYSLKRRLCILSAMLGAAASLVLQIGDVSPEFIGLAGDKGDMLIGDVCEMGDSSALALIGVSPPNPVAMELRLDAQDDAASWDRSLSCGTTIPAACRACTATCRSAGTSGEQEADAKESVATGPVPVVPDSSSTHSLPSIKRHLFFSSRSLRMTCINYINYKRQVSDNLFQRAWFLLLRNFSLLSTLLQRSRRIKHVSSTSTAVASNDCSDVAGASSRLQMMYRCS